MAKPEERKRARELRKQGWAIHEIVKELKIRKETVSKWVRDIQLTDELKAAMKERNPHWEAQQKGAEINKQNAYEQRMIYQDAGRKKAKEGILLHLMGSILYWGEGAKDRVGLRFINTDANMLQLFIRFLREEMLIKDESIGLQILHHTTDENDIKNIRRYWLDCLALPSTTRVSMQLKVGTTTRKKRYANGICAIEVGNVEVLQHIYGAIQEYIGFEQLKWGE